MTPLQKGAEIGGKYRVQRVLGEGGMGVVLEAEDRLTGAQVAIKRLHPPSTTRAEVLARARAEVRASARISHPNVVEVYDVFEEADTIFVVMERLEGEPLSAAIGREPVERLIGWSIEAMRGVLAGHRQGVVHRDIKPANIFLARLPDRAEPIPKVLDFGIAKVADPEAPQWTQAGVAMGTPLYMSPEQWTDARKSDARSDVYSFGVILFQILTGRLPFQASSYEELLIEVATQQPPPIDALRPDLPPTLARLVERAMARVPAQRIELSELIRELQPFASRVTRDAAREAPASSPSDSLRPVATVRRLPRSKSTWFIASCALMSLAAALAWVAGSRNARARLGAHEASCSANVVAACELACAAGSVTSCSALGARSLQGDGTAQDAARAAELFERACDAGDGQACTRVGEQYEHGSGVPADKARAAQLYERGCKASVAAGCTFLGWLYHLGNGVAHDDARAAQLLTQACDAGQALGCNDLGVLYRLGNGVAADAATAAKLYQRACDAGEHVGCANLGSLYHDGEGVTKDKPRGIKLITQACDAGAAEGCYRLGSLYQVGDGVRKDAARAVQLLQKACDGRHAAACSQLGAQYDAGEGVPHDGRRAVQLFEQACGREDPLACGILAERGIDSARDAARAARLYQKACETDATACLYLGLLYQRGEGVAKDRANAARLVKQGCKGKGVGCMQARRRLRGGAG